MRRRAFAAAASVVVAAIAVGGAAAIPYESRSLTASKEQLSNGKFKLTLTLTTKHTVHGCYGGAPVRFERRRPDGSWRTIKRGTTTASGLLSWTVVGVKAPHRAVAPQIGATATNPRGEKVICRPVILGFDKGYLSPG